MKQNQSQNQRIAAKIDITGDLCPLTFVKSKLFLEQQNPGEIVEIRLAEGEPLENLPIVLTDEGHDILSLDQEAESPKFYRMILKVGP